MVARLEQQQAEVEASREHRGVMLDAARRLDSACEDVAWLTAFEQDEDRYKVWLAPFRRLRVPRVVLPRHSCCCLS